MKKLLLIGLIIALTGCSSKYQQSEIGGESKIKLDKAKTVFIGSPKPTQYSNSGTATTGALNSAFSRYARTVKVSGCDDVDICMEQSKEYDYLVVPDILFWEDRATEWSGKADKIEIKVSVIDIATKAKLKVVIINGKSKWLTFGGDHPQDLLPEPVNKFVASLY